MVGIEERLVLDMHDGFLRGIAEAPEEDATRLIDADWLEETGEPVWAARAELIRAQVERFRLRNRSKNRQARLLAREGELLAAWRNAWLGPWAALAPWLVFHRGVPERLTGEAEGWFIGRRLGNDGGFTDTVEFAGDGRLNVYSGDRNSAQRTLHAKDGTYRIDFTYREVRLLLEVWQVERQTLRFGGRFGASGFADLVEQGCGAGRRPQAVSLRFG